MTRDDSNRIFCETDAKCNEDYDNFCDKIESDHELQLYLDIETGTIMRILIWLSFLASSL